MVDRLFSFGPIVSWTDAVSVWLVCNMIVLSVVMRFCGSFDMLPQARIHRR